MSFFSFFKKNKNNSVVYSPANGEANPLSVLDDKVFSEKVLGDGFIISNWDGNVYAPVSGELKTVFPTGHAYGIETADGLNVLVHIGIDTVNLEGKGFKAQVQQNQKVKSGDLLAVVDLDFLKSKGVKTDVITVVTTDSKLQPVEGKIKTSGNVTIKDVMISEFK